jgi:drug/metabolite transporter (DMT)-like permease
VRGVLWMLGAVLSFAAMAVAVRELQRHMGSFEIVFLRSIVMLCLALGFMARSGFAAVRTRRIGAHFSRNLIHLLGQILWVYSDRAPRLPGLMADG